MAARSKSKGARKEPPPADEPPATAAPLAGPGVPGATLLSAAAREAIARAVHLNAGHEVFFLGRVTDGLVTEVEDVARGNAHMVPVLRQLAEGYDVAIHNHPSGDLTPSDPDLHVAAELGDLGVGFYIVSNDAERAHAVVKVFPRPAPPPPVSLTLVERLLGSDGPLAERLPGYEARPEQLDMARAVAGVLDGHGIGVIEAGTGTGKSLAYLAPAAVRALSGKGEKVVVSTHTIHLQEQLIEKDLPLLAESWSALARRGELPPDVRPDPPRVVLMKGRSHYACLRKVQDLATSPMSAFESEAERHEVEALARWALTAREGARQELSHEPSFGAWDKVAVDADACTRTACPFYQECFYFKARREAAGADIIVANHALLMADMAIRRQHGFTWSAVLPPYRHVIIDEAHHLEDVAAEHLGGRITSLGVLRLLGRLESARRSRTGLLHVLADKAARMLGTQPILRSIEEDARPLRQTLQDQCEQVFFLAAQMALSIGEAAPRGAERDGGAFVQERAGAGEGGGSGGAGSSGGEGGGGASIARLLPAHRLWPAFDAMAEAVTALALGLLGLARVLHRLVERVEDLTPTDREALTSVCVELTGIEQRLARTARSLQAFLEPEDDADPAADDEGFDFAFDESADGAEDPWAEEDGPGASASEGTGEGASASAKGAAQPSTPLRAAAAREAPRAPRPGLVRWIEIGARGFGSRQRILLQSAPLEVAEILGREVFPQLGGVVLTSATLTVGGTFRYMSERLGVHLATAGGGAGAGGAPTRPARTRPAPVGADASEVPKTKPLVELCLPSPFDYPRQALLAVASDMPSPSSGGFEAAVARALEALARASGGGAFFLFTSHAQMRRLHARLAPTLRAAGMHAMCQGEESKRSLVQSFREGPPAVLFGTDTFWEGVDIRGDRLRLVVIVKLPFRVPTEPLQEARAEALERAGMAPFQALMLPQAVLKLKQGFGRLIRSKRDRGAVVCLDHRMITKSYGRVFLRSLPPARRVQGPLDAIIPAVAEIAGAPPLGGP